MGPAVPLIAAGAGFAASGALATSALGGAFTLGILNAGIGFSAGGAIAFTSSLAGFVVSSAVNAVGSRAFSGSGSSKRANFSQDAKAQATMVRSSVESHKIIYGQAKVSGPVVFIGTTNSGPDANGATVSGTNVFIHVIIALAAHEVDRITQIYFNDVPITMDAHGWVTTAPYTVSNRTTTRNISTAVRAASVVTVTTTVGHGFASGDTVRISGVSDSTMDGSFNITVTGATTFTYSNGGSNNSASGGTAEDLTSTGSTSSQVPFYISTISRTAGVVTVTTVANHGLSPGDTIRILSVSDKSMTGTYTVVATPTASSFTYNKNGNNGSFTGGTGDATITTTTTPSYARVKLFNGADDQAASAELMAEVPGWTANHRLRGTAYIYARLQYNPNVFTQGIPNISAVVQGKKVYDPRTATTLWTDNVALCIRDYLTSVYGFNCDEDEINDDYFSASANICDEGVTLTNGGSNIRYSCNGVIDTAVAPLENLNALVASMAGAVTYVQGQFRAHAGAYDMPVADLDISMLAGDMKIQTRPPRQQIFNAVKGTYVDPALNYQPTDFAAVTNAVYEADDGGQRIFKDVQLPLTNDAESAQRIAKIVLEQGRQGIQIELPLNHQALPLCVFDTVTFTHLDRGWNQKVFRIKRLSTSGVGPIILSLQEEASASYDWNSGEATTIDPAPDTNLPNPLMVQPPKSLSVTESLYVTRDGGGVKALATMTWLASQDVFVFRYQPEHKLSTDDTWTTLPRTDSATAEILDIVPGIYDFRVKAMNNLGMSSAYATTSKQIAGLSAPPSALTNFSLNAIHNNAHLSWNQSTDLDVREGGKIRLRYSPDLLSATWTSSIDLGPAIPGNATQVVVPLMNGTYLIKPVDSSGNEATTATTIVSTVANIVKMNQVAESIQHPDFPALSEAFFFVLVDGALQLDSPTLFDSVSGNFDDAGGLFDGGNGAPSYAQGVYDFGFGGAWGDPIDLGKVTTARVTANIAAEIFDPSNTFDQASGDFDDRQGRFDGDDLTGIETTLYIYTSDDLVTYSDPRPFFVGDYTARGFAFTLHVQNQDELALNIRITELSVTADVPDIIDSDTLTTSAAGVTTVTFSRTFVIEPDIGITIQDAQTGDFEVVQNVTEDDFEIGVKNSGGSFVARTVSWVASGY